jgi:predicted lysophospholipase L1 biosynthesis ABC-type transport system permease subunit
VAVVTESIARRYFRGQSPVGKHLGFKELDVEIVGVVRDARSATLHNPPPPMVYFSIEQPPATWRAPPINLGALVQGDPRRVVSAMREALHKAEPGLLVDSVVPMSGRLARDIGRERIVAYLASGFAVLALLLAALGLYGVLSYTVAGRTKEIGVRMALGAKSSEVAALVVRDALGIVGIGVVAGSLAAIAVSQFVKTLLFDVTPYDPAAYAFVLATLAAITLLAAYLPARRAVRVDPISALRSE